MHNETPSRISCIIPVHNRVKLLRQAIESVIAQNHPDTELIVVDDKSDDSPAHTLSELQRDNLGNLKIRFHRLLQRGGANAARAYGQARASGQFVQFLDSDDVLLSDKWQAQLTQFCESPNLDVSVGGTYKLDSVGDRYCSDPGFPSHEITAETFLAGRVAFKIGAPLWRRAALSRVVTWPANLESSQDWETHVRGLLCGLRFEYCPNSGFLIGNCASDRIAHRTVAQKAKHKLLAIKSAIEQAHKLSRKVTTSNRFHLLAVATRNVAACLRHRDNTVDYDCISAFVQVIGALVY